MEYYFKPDDKLDRERYAKFLETLLLRCDDYRREDSDGAYVIALDSPWGTGKTRFVKMLRNHLEGRTPKLVGDKVDKSFIPEPDEDRAFNVIYYNAWETDFWSDALEPLISSIMDELYIFLLCVKFRESTTYRKLCDGEYTENERRELMIEPIVIKPEEVDYSNRRLQLLGRPESLKHLAYIIRDYDNRMDSSGNTGRIFESFFFADENETQQLYYYLQDPRRDANGFLFPETKSLDQVLFYADLKKWEEIKDLTLGQYYYRQLEMFDFVLPADETKAES